jgi:flavin-dependent dehydrogenase
MRADRPTDTIAAVVRELDPDLADRVRAAPTDGVRTFRGAPGFLRRPFGPGWALVGDAGWWKDPLATHGITDALRDAQLLARAILDGRNGAREIEAMSNYEVARDQVALPMRDVVDQLASHEWDLADVPELLRTLSSAMAVGVETLLRLDQPLLAGPVAPTPS